MMNRMVIAALAWLVTVDVAAQDQPLTPEQEQARQHYVQGESLADQGRWAGALEEFERAYALAEGLPTRYLIGLDVALANAELERWAQAVRLLEAFMEAAPPDEPRRPEAEQRLAEARRRLALQGGGQLEASPIGIAILAVGAASVVAGAILGGVALQQDSDARAMCVGTSCTDEAFNSIGAAGDLAIGADIMLWGGLGIAALGSILAVALGTSSSATASAMCTDRGCALGVAGRF